MDFHQKEHLSNMVAGVCSAQDIASLKKILPTAESLVEYRDVHNGGGFLHTLMYSYANKPVDFLYKVMKEYDLDKKPEIKKQLFLLRNANGKYPADFTYTFQYFHPKVKKQFDWWKGKETSLKTDVPDNRSEFEKGKVALYLELKKQIQVLDNKDVEGIAFGIAKPYADASDNLCDTFSKGTPVSNGMYLPDKSGKPALYIKGSVKEEYPEIRLLNYANEKENRREDVCVLRGIKFDDKETFLSQAINKMDFPEDFALHFPALKVFDDDYKRLRSDVAKNATYQYFTQNRGVVVFETEQQKSSDNNSKDDSYGGYTTYLTTKEKGMDVGYPVIVLPSGFQFGVQGRYNEKDKSIFANTERKLYHELFHAIDMSGNTHFSEMPIFKYAVMLEENNPKSKFKYIFDIVNNAYGAESYNLETAAYIMGVADKEVLAASPLLSKVYELGECFCKAKCANNRAALGCLATAMDRFLPATDLKIEHIRFMNNKQQGLKSGIDESKRQNLEKHLIKRIDGVIETMKKMHKDKILGAGKELNR